MLLLYQVVLYCDLIMSGVPTLEAMQSVPLIMARALQDLHKFIEAECNHDDPQEIIDLLHNPGN